MTKKISITTSLEKSNEVFHSMHKALLTTSLILISLYFTSCKEKQQTPDWSNTTTEPQTKPQTKPQTEPLTKQIQTKPTQASPPNAQPIRFVSYNIRNYLTMRRGKTNKFKPEHEIKALISNISRANPHILGICEIGTQQDLDHLQNRLKQAGCILNHTYLSAGPDPYRRQALLSKFPIHPHNVPKYTYNMKGKTHEIRRGILDASIETPKGNLRLLGAHLKSKRPIAFYDQAVIRREEAQLLRKHASTLLSDASRKLILFGDMNDTKGSNTIRLMRGPKKLRLNTIELFDKQGTKWTQYWAKEDIYSRFDFIFVSNSLLPQIDKKRSHILDTPPRDPASDHRALVIIIN